MANQTVTVDTDLESVIAGGLLAGENITINNGAVVTMTQNNSVILGRVIINDGKFLIDGTAITANNIINLVGEGGHSAIDETITVGGQGTFECRGAWFNIGTTDGTNSQAIDLSRATGVGVWDNGTVDFCPSTIPMIQVETGRRINYTGATGLAPVVGDMVTLISDRTVMGKIVSVAVGYVVVRLLTGSFVGGESIQIRKVVDNTGADLQQTWTATVSGADVKEAGVYAEFGNSRSDETSYIATFGSGYGGLVFDNAFASTTLTMGSSIGGGFVPPSGCNIRVPNINLNSSRIAEFALNQAYMPNTNNNEANWYGLECSAGGTISLDVVNSSNFMLLDAAAFAYDASYVGAVSNLGSHGCASRVSFDHCVVVQDPVTISEPNVKQFGGCQDLINGADVTNCMVVNSRILGVSIGGATSIDVNISDCIVTSAGNTPALDTYAVHHFYFSSVTDSTNYRCMSFGNDDAAQNQALSYLRGTGHVCKDFMLSTTQDYSFQTQEIDSISIIGVDGLVMIGIGIIGNGVSGDDLIAVTDALNVKIRAIGMIDDKIDFGTDGEYMVQLMGLCDNVDIARCWKTGGAIEEAVSIPTTCRNTTVRNVSGKYASELQPSGTNTQFKGVHGGSGTYGSSIGWEDNMPSSFGHSFHDGFQSDTNGTIICTMLTPSSTTNETTIISGNPKFFKDNDLDLVSGSIIEFEQGYFAKGHTGFTGNYTAATGTAGYFANEWPNITLDFQWMLEGGAWNGAWLDVRTPANLTSISGNIAAGIKFKFRFTATGTQSSMSALMLESTTTLADQSANLYPIDQVEATFTFSINKSITAYEWRIYQVNAPGSLAGAVELAGQESEALQTNNYTYSYTVDTPIAVQIIGHANQIVESITYFTLTDQNQSVNIILQDDTNG